MSFVYCHLYTLLCHCFISSTVYAYQYPIESSVFFWQITLPCLVMTPTRGKKRLAALNYGQRRRRLRHLASYASSVDSPKTLLSVQQPTIVRPPPLQQWRRDPGHDSNNNVPIINPSGKSYLVGAIVYKTLEDDLRLHVFDQYVVKV